jgi:hypothetical protein
MLRLLLVRSVEGLPKPTNDTVLYAMQRQHCEVNNNALVDTPSTSTNPIPKKASKTQQNRIDIHQQALVVRLAFCKGNKVSYSAIQKLLRVWKAPTRVREGREQLNSKLIGQEVKSHCLRKLVY